jgi:hypothetical protein
LIAEWDKLINRIKLETNQRLGAHKGNGVRGQSVVAIRVVLLVDCEGQPLTWLVESSNVEPAARARTLLELL